ncbi:hypothetical protein BGZ65_007329, partial [Modicella reniformis]
MTIHSNNQPIQAFKSQATGRVANITTRPDSRTGEPIVLWRDIQSGFKNAESIWNGEYLVSPLTDENLEPITPLRIAYQSGAVLKVVEGNGQVHSTGEPARLAEVPLTSGGLGRHTIFDSAECTTNFNTLTRTIAALVAANINTNNNSPAIHSPSIISEESQLSRLPPPNQIHSPSTKAIEAQTLSIRHLEKQLKRISKKQDLILQKQQQTLERLAFVQNRVQALLTQTYELHEYPIPRLFIVLPKNPGFLGKLNTTSVPYR